MDGEPLQTDQSIDWARILMNSVGLGTAAVATAVEQQVYMVLLHHAAW